MQPHRLIAILSIIAAAVVLVACGGGSSSPTPTPAKTAAPPTATVAAPTSTPPLTAMAPAPTASPPSMVVDPCTLMKSLEGQPLSPGVSFALNADTKWQLCVDGAAAGSSEKYLFHTTDGGATWKLISQTTLGNPTPQAGVGQLPNGNGISVILFLDDTNGWMGLTSPGVNLYRSQDGGVDWTEVPVIPAAVPITSITFSDPQHGAVVTPDGDWTTSDGGNTWTKSP